jgi:Sap-like sulfolipid-1-addressing protein
LGGLVLEAALFGAVLTASSPIAIVAVLVMMPAVPHGKRSATSFVAGWGAVLLAIGVVVIFGTGSVDMGSKSTATAVLYWVELALGIAGMVYAWVRFRRIKARGAPPRPKWLERAGRVPPVAAFGLGALLPYYVVALACLGEVLESGQGTGAQFVAYLVFVAVSTGLLASPLLVAAFSGQADAKIAAMRTWLDRNDQNLITAFIAVIGLFMTVRGLLGLLQR